MDKRRGTGGFALPVAVFALVILGVLVTGGFYTVRQEMWIGAASADGQKAFYLAEQGVGNTLNNWSTGTFTTNGTWNSVTVADTVKDGFWTVEVTPMTDHLYLYSVDRDRYEGGLPQVGRYPAGGNDRTPQHRGYRSPGRPLHRWQPEFRR